MTNNIVIDLEYLDMNETSIIVSLGVVPLTFSKKYKVKENYARNFNFNIKQQYQSGRTVSFDNISWWLNQDEHVRKEFDNSIQENKSNLLIFKDLAYYLNNIPGFFQSEPIIWWGNGTKEDTTKLYHLINSNSEYKQVFQIYSQNLIYWRNFRCYRTLKNIFDVDVSDLILGTENASHDPMDDAIQQAKHLARIANNYNFKLK